MRNRNIWYFTNLYNIYQVYDLSLVDIKSARSWNAEGPEHKLFSQKSLSIQQISSARQSMHLHNISSSTKGTIPLLSVLRNAFSGR
jgi:hypothetical protein